MDVNCDLGEGVGDAQHDWRIMPFISSTSVACGGHAGDGATMAATVAAAVDAGVVVGAHPSYPDREGFGRVTLTIDPGELARSVAEQVAALAEVCAAAGTAIRYVKLHGALYNDAARDAAIATAVLEGVDPALPVLTLPGAELGRLAAVRGTAVFTEAFPDRGYRPDGSLQPRTEPDAVIHDPRRVAERALRLVLDGVIDTVDGGELRFAADSLCIHGDAPGAEDAAAAVAAALARNGITPQPFVR